MVVYWLPFELRSDLFAIFYKLLSTQIITKRCTNLPKDSTSIFLHLPSTMTRWWPPFADWKSSKADSAFLARDESIFRRSQERVMASEAWSSLWNTSKALMEGFGGMRWGNFPSLNFCCAKREENVEKRRKNENLWIPLRIQIDSIWYGEILTCTNTSAESDK